MRFLMVDDIRERFALGAIPVEDVKQMLRELGLEQFYLNGSETSPPLRIPYNSVKQAVQEIYKRKK